MHAARTPTAGFTLLELLVVLTIVSLLAATAAVKLSSGYRRAQFRRAVETVGEIDQLARQLAAGQRRPYELRLKVSDSAAVLTSSGRRDEAFRREWRLPGPIEFAYAGTARERRSSGDVVISFDGFGRSDSYAVGIQSPAGQEQWLLVAGGTGQTVSGDSKRSVEEALRDATKTGPNAR